MIIVSECRAPGLFGAAGRRNARAVMQNQPLLLIREPANPVDANAVICATLLGEPIGYVAREHAARLAPQLDAGHLWCAKVLIPWLPAVANCRILLWREKPRPVTKRRHVHHIDGNRLNNRLENLLLVEDEDDS